MSKRTVLMNKLFSDSTPKSFKKEFAEKVLEAKEGDSCEYCEGAEDLHFSLEGDEVLVEDRANNELTSVSLNEENPTEMQLEAYSEDPSEEIEMVEEQLPEETEALEEEIHTESENLQSVEVEVLPGPDGEAAKELIEDLRIEIAEGIDDAEKSGTRVYSMVFKGVPHDKAKKIAKAFSQITSPIDAIVDSADVDEDVEVSINDEGEVKVMSFSKVKTFSNDGLLEGTRKPKDHTFFNIGKRFIEKLYEIAEETGIITKAQIDYYLKSNLYYPGQQPVVNGAYRSLKNRGKISDRYAAMLKDVMRGRELFDYMYSEEDPEENEEMTADALMEKANQLAAEVAEGVNKENAEAVKAKAEEILVEAEKLESNGSNCSFLKLMCNQYCDAATKAMSESEEETPAEEKHEEEEQYEEGFEAGEQYEEGKEAEKADEGDQREFSDDTVEYVLVYDDGNLPDVIDSKDAACIKHRKSFPKSASNREKREWATKMAEEDGNPGEPVLLAWEDDADGGCYVEAYSNTKQFSDNDPKVTVTVTNIEPASLSKLLGATEEPKEEEEAPEFSEPKVDPNEEQGRHFSKIEKGANGVSFLLTSEIN